MDGSIDFNGRSVDLQVQYDRGLPSSTVQFGFIVAEAVLSALHYPLAVTVKSVVVAIARTATDISIEVDGERNRSRITRQLNTAHAYNNFLLVLRDDYSWDPEVKAELDYSLREDLKNELRRIRL